MKSFAISIDWLRKEVIRKRLWVLALALWASAVHPALAQEISRYEVALQGISLEDALHELLLKTELELAYEQRLVTGRYTYCAIKDALAEDVLRCVLAETGLDFFRLSSGLYVLVEQTVASPRYGALQGTVVDAETGEPLSQAHIKITESLGTVANDEGRFLIPDLEPGYYNVATSFIGYRRRVDVIRVPPDSIAQAHVELLPYGIPAVPIVVDGLQDHGHSEFLGAEEIAESTLMSAGSTPDINRVIGSMVGIRLNDATADLHIQSSGSGEHQYRLDGAPVFVPATIAGLIGPFSPYGLGRITVHKTGFAADIGSQLSGVVDATHALFPRPAKKLNVQLDPMGLNARLGFGTRRGTSFMAAARSALWEELVPVTVRNMLTRWNSTDEFMYQAFPNVPDTTRSARLRFPGTESPVLPSVGFGDAHLALEHRFGALRSIKASAYWGRRRLDSTGDVEEASNGEQSPASSIFSDFGPLASDRHVWTNLTAQAKYEAVLGGRLMASLRTRLSHYAMRHDILRIEPIQRAAASLSSGPAPAYLRDDSGNKVQEAGLEARVTYLPRRTWQIEAGVEPVHTRSRFLIHGIREFPIAHLHRGSRITGFLKSRIAVTGMLSADAGIRTTTILKDGTTYVEPRLALRYDASGEIPWSARVSSGIYRQFVNQFDVSSRSARALLSGTRMWLGHDSSVRPPLAVHWSAELLVSPRPTWTLRAEAYYKQLRHILAVDYAAQTYHSEASVLTAAEFLEGAWRYPSVPQRQFLASGRGFARGLAVVLEKRHTRGRISTSYEYSASQRSFSSIFDGDRLNAPWLEPHRIEVTADYNFGRHLTMRTRIYGILGRTWAFQQSYYDFFGAYGSRLTGRLSELGDLAVREFGSSLDVPTIVRNMLEHNLRDPDHYTLSPLVQLDLSAAYTRSLGASEIQMRVDLINALSGLKADVVDWYLVDSLPGKNASVMQPAKRRLLPLTPLLAVRVSR